VAAGSLWPGSSTVKLFKGCWFPFHFIYRKIEKKLRGNLIFPGMSFICGIQNLNSVGGRVLFVANFHHLAKNKGERGGEDAPVNCPNDFFGKRAQSYHSSRKKKCNLPYLERSIKKAGSNTYRHQLEHPCGHNRWRLMSILTRHFLSEDRQ
jgi:hypothetical protein